MPPTDFVFGGLPTSSTILKWSPLLPREDSQGTRASISRRLESLEERIRGHVPTPAEIVRACDDSLESTMSNQVLANRETTIQTTLILLIHASLNTDYIGWLNDKSLHYRLRLLDVPNADALELHREVYESTIMTLENAIASARFRDSTFMEKPLEPLPHCVPTQTMLEVGRLCKDSGSAMMRKLFYIATAYAVPSNCNYAGSYDRCKDTECSHIDCQFHYTTCKE
jgi:hypothetical protein